MNNLFLIHTPFQLTVAQSIVNTVNGDNYLVIIIRKEIKNSIETMKLLLLENTWKDVFFIENIDRGILKASTFYDQSIKNDAIEFYSQILEIISNLRVSALYFGDPKHIVYNNISLLNSSKNIFYLEEGVSSYYKLQQSLKVRLFNKYSFIFFYSLNVKKSFIFKLFVKINPIYFSSIKQSSKTHFNLELKFSDKLANYLNDIEFQPNSNLFISTSLTPLIPDYTVFLRDLFCNYTELFNEKLYIKFHPIETEDVKHIFVSVLNELKVNFEIISDEYAIPVEYFVAKIKPKKVYGFDSSSLFLYVPIIFKNMDVVFLFENTYKLLSERNLLNEVLEKWYIDCKLVERNLIDLKKNER